METQSSKECVSLIPNSGHHLTLLLRGHWEREKSPSAIYIATIREPQSSRRTRDLPGRRKKGALIGGEETQRSPAFGTSPRMSEAPDPGKGGTEDRLKTITNAINWVPAPSCAVGV